MKCSVLSVTAAMVLIALDRDTAIVCAEEPGHYTYYQVRPARSITNANPIRYGAPATRINLRNPTVNIGSPAFPLASHGSPVSLNSRPSRILLLEGPGTGVPGRRLALRHPWGSSVGGGRVIRLLNSGARGVLFPSPVGVGIPANGRVFTVRRNGTDWNYKPVFGPPLWSKLYPACSGLRQSPINIKTKHVTFGVMEQVNTINFQTQLHSFSVMYDGATVKVTPTTTMYMKGVGVRGQIYTVDNFHFHWSSLHHRGSEHALDGVRFPMEMHILCYMSKYGSLEAAKIHKDGLAVVAVIFDFGKECPALRTILTATNLMRAIGDEVSVFGLDVTKLLPARLDYFFRYHGSITTPPCSENVFWTVYEHVQTMSPEQFRMFQQLRRGRFGKATLTSNVRPLQADNNRPVISNNPLFASDKTSLRRR